MRWVLALTFGVLIPVVPSQAQEPGAWQTYETSDTLLGWGDLKAEGMTVYGRRFLLSKTPQSSFMGDVSWMTHDFTMDCLAGTFTQGSGQYLALDGTVMGPSAPRPLALIEKGTGEELIKIAVCDGRPIEGTHIEQTREGAMTAARLIAAAAP